MSGMANTRYLEDFMMRHLRPITPAVLVLLTACSALSTRDQRTYQQGLAAVKAGNWTDAVRLFGEVLERNADYGPASLGRGRSRFELGLYEEAKKDLQRALETDDLEENASLEALLLEGRCFIEIGKAQFDRVEDNGTSEAFEKRRAARTSFVHANSVLSDLLELQPAHYEGLLWRAYSYLRLQNHRRALELLRACDKIAPDHWQHRFFKALTIEDLYQLNAESLNLYLEMTSSGFSPELTPVYEHLVEVFPKAHEEYQERILERLEEFAARTPEASPELQSLLQEARERIEREERAKRRRAVLSRVSELAEDGQFEEALAVLEEVRRADTSDEVSDAIRDIREEWSLRLEAEALTLLRSEDKERLQEALETFQKAHELTERVDRLGALQQRIDDTQLALTRRVTSQKLQKCYALLKRGAFKEVLDALERIPTHSLENEERDLYYYLQGIGNFKLKRWRSAVDAFDKIDQRPSQDLDLLYGLALVYSGEKERGIRYLEAVPEEKQDDNLRKLLAEYFLQQKQYDKAMVYLEAIRRPLPSHYELRVKVRENLGITAYRRGDYEEAIEHLVAARDVVERHLDHKAILVYLYLGHSYYRTRDFVRARETYADLSNTHLSEVEQRRCRELYLYRARIHLKDRQAELAYRDLARFVRLGGEIPSDSLQRQYAWLLATYADFMPLDRIHHWQYVDTATGKSYRLLIKERIGDEYVVERHEDQTVSRERWSRDGVFLLKTVGKDVWRIPINLEPAKESFPSTEYSREEGAVTYSYKTEIQSNDETVMLPGEKEMTGCIKVRLWRKKTEAGNQKPSFLVYVLYFAPDIGEVKRDVILNNIKLSEIVLSGFAYRSETLGN